MIQKRFLRSFLIAVLACAQLPVAARADMPPYVKVVSIAVVGPMSGPDRQAGIDLANGVQEAVDETNDLRGITDFGWAVHTFDDQNDPGVAQQQSQFALVDTTTAFVIGHVGGQATLFGLQAYHQAEIPVIVPFSPLAAITAQHYDDVFRICPSDVDEGTQDARYAERTIKAKKVAVIYEEDDYGVDGGQGFIDYARSGRVMAAKDFSVDVELKHLPTLIAGVKAYAPDLLFVAGNGDVMAKAIKALRSAGVSEPILATQAFSTQSVLKTLGSQAEGMIVSSCMPPMNLIPTAQQFLSRYRSHFGQVSPFSVFGYVAGQVAIAAARQARSADKITLDRQLSVGAFQTVIGPISFDRNGDPALRFLYMYKVQNGAPATYLSTASGIPNPAVIK